MPKTRNGCGYCAAEFPGAAAVNGVGCCSDLALRIKSIYLVGLADCKLSLIARIFEAGNDTWTATLVRWQETLKSESDQ